MSAATRPAADPRPWLRGPAATLVGALIVTVGLAVVGLLLPETNYYVYLGFLFFLFTAQSFAWNLIGGYGGQVSFGHATFFGIGAYVTALLQQNAGWPPLLALAVAGLAAAVFSAVWGYPLFRLRGFYFAIATIGINEATRLIALNPLRGLTGGASGFRLRIDAGSGRTEQYLAALALALAAFLISYWVRNSALGLGLFALNMDTEAAETVGVDTVRLKAIALALSAFIVGLSGGLYARAILYINPNDVFAFAASITMVLMVVIGGVATLAGPILGAFIYVVIQDYLGAASVTLGTRTYEFRDVQIGLYGLLLALIILFEPSGLVGMFRRVTGLRRRSTSRDAEAQRAVLKEEAP